MLAAQKLRPWQRGSLPVALFVFALACDETADTPVSTGGSASGGSLTTSSGGTAGASGGAVTTAGTIASAAGTSGATAFGGTGGNDGTAGTNASSGAGGSGGASAGTSAGGTASGNGGGGSSGSGGAGGSSCGTLNKAEDGSYERDGWTAEYTCTGGDCPPRSQDDTGDVFGNAFDGDYQSRWSTGVFQSSLDQQQRFPLYFTVDMKQSTSISRVTTHPGCKDYYDSPGTIEVQVSTDGTNFKTVTDTPHTPKVPQNEACPPHDGAVATDVISFAPVCARYVRLKGTRRTTSDRYWAIGELMIFP